MTHCRHLGKFRPKRLKYRCPSVRSGMIRRRYPFAPLPQKSAGNTRSRAQQHVPQHDGLVVDLIVRRIDKGDRAVSGQASEFIELATVLRQLASVTSSEFIPFIWIMSEPFPQSSARRKVLHPLVNVGIGFPHPARPQPVNQNPDAIVARRRLVCAL